jgi:hypothetical protein
LPLERQISPGARTLLAGRRNDGFSHRDVQRGAAGRPALSLQATGTYKDDPQEQGSFIRTEGVFANAVASDVIDTVAAHSQAEQAAGIWALILTC